MTSDPVMIDNVLSQQRSSARNCATYAPHPRRRIPARRPNASEVSAGALFKVSPSPCARHWAICKGRTDLQITAGGTQLIAKPTFQNVSSLRLASPVPWLRSDRRLRSFKFIPADKRGPERFRGLKPWRRSNAVRLINREPISLEITYLPKAIGERLEKRSVTATSFPDSRNDCGIALGHADLAIDAVLADGDLTQAHNVSRLASCASAPYPRCAGPAAGLRTPLPPWRCVPVPPADRSAKGAGMTRNTLEAGARHRRDRQWHGRADGGDQGQRNRACVCCC